LNQKSIVLLNRYDEEARPDHDRYARELDALTAQAIAVDAQNPVSWSYRRNALIFNGQWAAAMAAADKTLDITRGAPWAWVHKALTATLMGQPDAALQWLQADPVRLSDAPHVLFSVCEAHLLLAQPRAAATACEQAAGGDPSIWSVHQYLAAALANLGQIERARASLQIVEKMSPGITIDRLRNSRWNAHPEYQRLAEATYFAGLRRAGMPER
jgi:tetratricopeptide (TPR) repeat protein